MKESNQSQGPGVKSELPTHTHAHMLCVETWPKRLLSVVFLILYTGGEGGIHELGSP